MPLMALQLCRGTFCGGQAAFYSTWFFESSWVEPENVGNERYPPESVAWCFLKYLGLETALALEFS